MEKAITSEILLQGYREGIFPMSEGREDPGIFWVNPLERGVFPVGEFHISRSLRRRILKVDYDVRISSAFAEVVTACAGRSETWINPIIFDLYCQLAEKRKAHSVEIWRDNRLIGGVYGVVEGGAFFGESMFSHETDGSKLALAYLDHRLKHTGFRLFDAQFITPHLASLGAVKISRAQYLDRLKFALKQQVDFLEPTYFVKAYDIVQRSGQTS